MRQFRVYGEATVTLPPSAQEKRSGATQELADNGRETVKREAYDFGLAN